MIKTYAKLDGTKVSYFVPLEENEDPTGFEYVCDGSIFFPLPPFPKGELHLVDGNLEWADTRTLEEAKVDKWNEIKEQRTAFINANMTTAYGVFQCKEEDRQNLTDAIQLANTLAALGQPVAISWTLADNSVVTLNQAQIVSVGLTLGQKVQAAHAQARVLRTAIDAATTVEEVNAVSWGQ